MIHSQNVSGRRRTKWTSAIACSRRPQGKMNEKNPIAAWGGV